METQNLSEHKCEVTVFPGKWQGSAPPPTEKDLQKTVDKMNRYHMNVVCQTASTHLFHSLAAAGYPLLEDPVYQKDINFLNEAIKSLVLKFYGQKHVIQDIAQGCDFTNWIDPKTVVKAGPPPKVPA